MYFVVYPIRDGNLTRLKFWSTELILIFRILTQIFRFWVGFELKNWGPIKIQVKVRFKPTQPDLKKKKVTHKHTLSHCLTSAHHTRTHHTRTQHILTLTHDSRTHHNPYITKPNSQVTNPKSADSQLAQHHHCQPRSVNLLCRYRCHCHCSTATIN